VPITIKEAFDVAGLHTTSSHPPLKDNVAREDASLVARLRAAGAPRRPRPISRLTRKRRGPKQ